MTATIGSATQRSRGLAALLVAALAWGGFALVSPHADALTSSKKAAKVSDGTMTWAVSNYVLVSNPATASVSEVHNAEAPAAFTAATGWTFSDGTGTYNPKSGATSIAFPGALEFGNTSRGNYAFKFADPTFALDADGSGTLTADVSVRPSGATAYNPAAKTLVVDVTGTPSKSKNHVEITAAPAVFSSALITAVGDLAAHFQASGSPNDPNKPPTPITVEFDYKVKKG